MKRELNLIIKIAEQFRDRGIKEKLPMRHNYMKDSNNKINSDYCVYFSNDYDVCSVKLNEIEVEFFTDSIVMPLKADIKSLKKVIKEAKQAYKNWIHEDIQG